MMLLSLLITSSMTFNSVKVTT